MLYFSHSYCDGSHIWTYELVARLIPSVKVLQPVPSDGNEEHPVTFGNSVHLCLGGDDEEELTKYFNALSEGGNVDMPLAKQFWRDTYGQVTDKYGIHWMVNILAKK